MTTTTNSCRRIRAGLFEIDLDGREIYKEGRRVPLQDQPFRVLEVLLERPGKVVTREELQARLWQADSFGALDEGINTAIRKLRIAFGDSADSPRYVETIPRRGYRFVAPLSGSVEVAPSSEDAVTLRGLPVASHPIAPSDAADVGSSGLPGANQNVARRYSHYLTAVVGVLILGVIALIMYQRRSPRLTSVRVIRFVQLTNDGQAKIGPIATDGVRIYFTELLPGQLRSLAQVSTGGGQVVRFQTPLSSPRVLDVSHDGTQMLVGNGQEGASESLWIQPIAGGSPRRVVSELVNDATWSSDGEAIVYGSSDGVHLIQKDGTLARKLLNLRGTPFSIGISPNSKALRFSLRELGGSSSILEASDSGSKLHELFPGCCGKWTNDERYFVFENEHDGHSDLWALRKSDQLRWKDSDNQPVQLTAGPLDFTFPTPSKDGKEVFAIGSFQHAEIVRYDSTSQEFAPYLSGVSAEGLSFSHDGKWVAYTSYPDGTLWKSKVDGSERVQLTFPPMRAFLPKWSPDGRQIAFMAHFPGRPWNIYLLQAEGGMSRQLLPDSQNRADPNWSPDGNALVFGSFDILNSPIFILDLRTGEVLEVPESTGLFSPRWSPDGRYLCAMLSEPPHKLMLFDFTTRKWTLLSDLNTGYPSWSRDGRYIYFEDSHNHTDDGSRSIDRIRLSDRKLDVVVNLKKVGRAATGTVTAWIGLAPDDAPLLSRDIGTYEIYALQWQEP